MRKGSESREQGVESDQHITCEGGPNKKRLKGLKGIIEQKSDVLNIKINQGCYNRDSRKDIEQEIKE